MSARFVAGCRSDRVANSTFDNRLASSSTLLPLLTIVGELAPFVFIAAIGCDEGVTNLMPLLDFFSTPTLEVTDPSSQSM